MSIDCEHFHEEDKPIYGPKDWNLINTYEKKGKTIMDAMAELQWQYHCAWIKLQEAIYKQKHQLALTQHYKDGNTDK